MESKDLISNMSEEKACKLFEAFGCFTVYNVEAQQRNQPSDWPDRETSSASVHSGQIPTFQLGYFSSRTLEDEEGRCVTGAVNGTLTHDAGWNTARPRQRRARSLAERVPRLGGV